MAAAADSGGMDLHAVELIFGAGVPGSGGQATWAGGSAGDSAVGELTRSGGPGNFRIRRSTTPSGDDRSSRGSVNRTAGLSDPGIGRVGSSGKRPDDHGIRPGNGADKIGARPGVGLYNFFIEIEYAAGDGTGDGGT